MSRIDRPRLRDLGITVGHRPTGPLNAITDVAGVRVGHATVWHDDPRVARTGVTAIRPNDGDIFMDRLVGGAFVLNGAGEMSGLIQVLEWGLIETPILLTNTLSVGAVSAATVAWMLGHYPTIGKADDVVIPLVGECDDSFLNDVSVPHVRAEHVAAALDGATGGPVIEGSVGGGTGMMSFGFKGGIGTASRVLAEDEGGYTVGLLVMSNVGEARDLRVDGVPVGATLASEASDGRSRYGSIIAVLATDAPLTAHQISRLCKRVALGIGRTGSYAAHGSGEIVIGFSTANAVPRHTPHRTYQLQALVDDAMNPLYQAAIEATEEAMLNALVAGETTVGRNGHRVPGLPVDRLQQIWQTARP